MIRNSNSVMILDRASGEPVPATIFEGFSELNMTDYENLWKPMLEKADREARDLQLQGEEYNFVEDEHWDWRDKLKRTKSASLSYKHFTVECDGKTQGMMQLNLTIHRSWENSSWNIVYVDYLAVAPWNRATIVEQPKYKGIGSVLLGQAMGASILESFKGRIGLHSLLDAREWYKKMGLKAYGLDSQVENLEYFEMNEQGAAKFLGELALN